MNTENLNTLKKMIEEQSGVPAELLTGETALDVIHQARQLLEWKPKDMPVTTRDQFAQVFSEAMGHESPDPAVTALEAISEAYEAETRLYPSLPDGGEIDPASLPDGRPTREQFADWANSQLAFDPKKDTEGWR